MFFLISNLYTAYENVDHIIAFIKPNFFLPNYRCFSSFFTYVHGLGSGKILLSHSFCFIFPYFSIGCPLSIFHLAPLHLSSCPSPSFILPLSIIHLPRSSHIPPHAVLRSLLFVPLFLHPLCFFTFLFHSLY